MKLEFEDSDGVKLVEHCVCHAERFGVDAMLNAIARIHQAYAALSNDPALKAAYHIHRSGPGCSRPADTRRKR